MMSLVLAWLPQLVGIGLALAGGTALYVGVRRSGVKAQQAADDQKTLGQVENRNAADADVAGKSDAAVDDELHRKWER